MKRIMGIMIASILITSSVFAQETETETEAIPMIPSQARWSLAKKALGLGAGFVAGSIFHELGHYTIAKMEGMDNVQLHATKVTYTYKEYNRRKRRNIAAGGFMADVFSSEILLASNKFPKDNSFVLGWLLWTIYNPINYTLRHEFSSINGYDDLKNLDETGIDATFAETGLLAHAALTAYRLWKNPDVPIFIRTTSREIMVGLEWKFKL
jgi:hypothetical protein